MSSQVKISHNPKNLTICAFFPIFLEGWTRWTGEVSPFHAFTPPPIPLSPYYLLSAARASRTQNFLLFPFLPFPNFSPLSLLHPLISNPPLTLSTSSVLMNKLFCFSVAKAMNCFRVFFFFFLFFFFCFFFSFVRNYEKTKVIVMSGWKDDT